MRHRSALYFACLGVALTAVSTGNALAQAAAAASKLKRTDDRKVIVILRDQMAEGPQSHGELQGRAFTIAEAQRPVIDQLQKLRPHEVRSFATINAFATSVSTAEAELLKKNSQVQAVVDDAIIRLPRSHGSKEEAGPKGRPSAVTETAKNVPSAAICNTLEPEALQLTNTAFLDPSTPQAQSLVDGAGVKVAYIADGLDVNNPDFIRANGEHVFIDYQNFSGDASTSPTGGAEAFGDASSIAAQGLQTYDISQYVNASHPLPSPCNIQIRGIAPGASLVGLDVFSSFGLTTTSNFVQAIEYAVVNANVDVINESFGANPYYDTGLDPISMANTVAVKSGVTVVVSSGDAGTAGTIGSPATNPLFISAGASTQFRSYQQTSNGAQPLSSGGWVSNNISSLSSGGFAQKSPRTIDIVAPGDLGWALCSANTSIYTECTSLMFVGSNIQDFGGTSESSPLTAGAAALVIEAYRNAHSGKSPSPALVKHILMSTASDLGAPSSEQGAGLLNTLAAVNAALSLHDSNGSPARQGSSLVFSTNSLEATDSAGKHESHTFTITNTGATSRHLTPVLQTLGAPTAGATISITMNPAGDPTFTFENGAPRAYQMQTFTVPSGADHLDAAIAYQVPNPTQSQLLVWLALLDPNGVQTAFSLPQGEGNGYGHVDVVKPIAGQWTAVIFTRVSGVTSYSGPLKFSWSTEKFVKFGTVSPSSFTLAPGASKSVSVSFSMPSNAGDVAAALRFPSSSSTPGIIDAQIPVTVRTLVHMNSHGGSFGGTLTGGNGRGSTGPVQTYEFDVPSGVKTLDLAVNVTDPNYLLEGFLVDPTGMQHSANPNVDNSGHIDGALQLSHEYPQAGRWHFVLLLDYVSSGNQTSLPFTAQISLNAEQYSAPGLPNSAATKLSASAGAVTIPISITNPGPIPETYFTDARLYQYVNTPQPVYGCSSSPDLPAPCYYTFLPTQSNRVEFDAASTVPITMDAENFNGFYFGTGSPDIYAISTGTDSVAATLSTYEVPWGYWYLLPSNVGPYDSGGAPSAPVKTSVTVAMRPFDPAVSSDAGDIISDFTAGTNTFVGLPLTPGSSGVIHLTITPNAALVGQTVKGYIYIDTYAGYSQTIDEVIRIPYQYTVAP